MGRRVRVGSPVAPHRPAVGRPVGDAGRHRRGDAARARSARWCAHCRGGGHSSSPRQRPPLDRLSGARMVLGLGLGVDSYGEYSTFGEPAADDRGRGAALDAGIELLLPMLAGDPVPAAGGRVTTAPSARRPRLPVWVAGTLGHRAGPRRVARFGLEGLSLVGAGEWTPELVTAALDAGGLAPGAVDVVLTGGAYPDPAALAARGATWCVPEFRPGTSAADVRSVIASGPGAR